MKLKFLLIFLILPFLLIPFFLSRNSSQSSVFVSRVIDGDTFELANGKKVRLLGIDAPEKDQYFYLEAKEKLKELIEGKEVFLEADAENKDSLGRLLRYVFVNKTFVNLEMVKQGYAIAYIVGPNEKYSEQLKQAEAYARENELGIWKRSFSQYSDCIKIKEFHFDARGDDRKNLNDEYIVFENICNFPLNLTGWIVRDKNFKTFVFPEFILNSNSEFTLFSGKGNNTETKLFWNSEIPIWDNNGDTLYLKDRNGSLVLTTSY